MVVVLYALVSNVLYGVYLAYLEFYGVSNCFVTCRLYCGKPTFKESTKSFFGSLQLWLLTVSSLYKSFYTRPAAIPAKYRVPPHILALLTNGDLRAASGAAETNDENNEDDDKTDVQESKCCKSSVVSQRLAADDAMRRQKTHEARRQQFYMALAKLVQKRKLQVRKKYVPLV